MERKVLAVDIGASKIEWAFFERGEMIKRQKMPTPKNITGKEIIDFICSVALKENANAVGVALPGFVKGGRVIKLPNLPHVEKLDIKNEVGKRTGIPVFVQNDVKYASLAQFNSGKAGENDNFVFVAPGTGIGGAIVVGGKLVSGKENAAGEFGHMKILVGEKGGKAKALEWEEICAGHGIEAEFLKESGKKMSAEEIFNSDNPAAKKVCKNGAYYFGIGLANIANTLNPEKIVIAGSVGKAYCAKWRDEMMRAFSSNAIVPAKNTKIVLCKFENPALLGAMLVAKNENETGGFFPG